MSFPPTFLDELRARLPASEVVGRKVKLQKRGREHLGLCPFHSEKTPSFTVNDDKGFFHCFGCGEHGDVISFVMKSEGLPFPEAVERLAGQAGLEVPRQAPRDRAREERQAGLGEAVEMAAQWFESQLKGIGGRAARDYLQRRGIPAGAVSRFRLGLAPDGRTVLKDALLARGVSEAVLVEAGLVIRPEDGGPTYDRFRNRLMFPIWDRRGRVVAFGGRALGEARAKYLNSPETPLFHKGGLLYGLHLAREKAREAGTVIVAEGYMDVIALAAAGFENAVAPLGTALTEEQMQELWRLVPEPVVCMDGDAAGLRAAGRAAERCLPLLKPGHSLRFAALPEGEDPDDLIRGGGAEAMAKVLESALPLSEMLWRRALEEHPLDTPAHDTPERRAAFRQALRRMAGRIADNGVQGFYRDHFRERLDTFFAPRRSAGGAMRGRRPDGRWGRPSWPRRGDRLSAHAHRLARRPEEVLMVAVLNHPELLESQAEAFASIEFSAPDLDTLRGVILDIAVQDAELDSRALKHHLAEQGFGELVEALTGPKSSVRDKALREGAEPEVAAQAWSRVLAAHRRGYLEAEIEALGARIGPQGDAKGWDILMSLKAELQRLEALEAELEWPE